MWDLVNGSFEAFGGFVSILSFLKLLKEKKVRGVSWIHISYFTLWGFWNLAYYPHLGQWTSFAGGVFVVLMNCAWLGLMIHYIRKEKHG